MLCDGTANRHATSAGSFTGQMRRGRVLVLNEVLRSRHEIINRVLLGQLLTCEMPILAILATTAHMGDGKYASTFQKGQPSWTEGRIQGDAVSAVTLQPGRMRTVQHEPTLVNDGERHQRAIRTFRLYLFAF